MIPPKRFDKVLLATQSIYNPSRFFQVKFGKTRFVFRCFFQKTVSPLLPMYVSMYLSIYGCVDGHTYSKSMDQPGKVVNSARGQLNRKNEYFPVRVRA